MRRGSRVVDVAMHMMCRFSRRVWGAFRWYVCAGGKSFVKKDLDLPDKCRTV